MQGVNPFFFLLMLSNFLTELFFIFNISLGKKSTNFFFILFFVRPVFENAPARANRNEAEDGPPHPCRDARNPYESAVPMANACGWRTSTSQSWNATRSTAPFVESV